MVVAAQHEIDAVDPGQQVAVVHEIEMGHRHHEVCPHLAQLLDRSRGDHRRGGEADRVARRRQRGGVGRQHAEEAQLVAGDLDQVQVDAADGRRPVRTQHVGAEPGIARRLDPLGRELRAEIELVVAQDRHLHADGIGQVDHLRALGQARHEGRREEVAAEGGNGVRVAGPLRLQERHERREAAGAFYWCDLVDVVAMQDGDRDLVRQRLAAVQRQRQRAEPGGGKNFAT